MKKKITVLTNDPVKPKLTLTISGEVENLFTISSKRVQLTGPAGQQLITSVTITPYKRYAFKVVEAKAKDGKHIAVFLNEKKKPDGESYVLNFAPKI